MNWSHDAACRGEDPELFFPVGTTGPALLQLADAKRVCARCPVQSACLQWALLTGMEHGVWGGMSEDERRVLRRRAARNRRLIPQPNQGDPSAEPRLTRMRGGSPTQQSSGVDVSFDAGGLGVPAECGPGAVGMVALLDDDANGPVNHRPLLQTGKPRPRGGRRKVGI